MSQSKNTLINQLCTEARKSLIEQQLAATILRSSKMVMKPCCNTPKIACRGLTIGSLHAEARALLNYFGKALIFDRKKGWTFIPTEGKRVQRLDLIVVRVNKMGEATNARPCYNCLNMMKSVGIRKVYYSVGPGKIVSENVKDMISIQASSVTKLLDRINGNVTVDNSKEYYETLLKKIFPESIKKYNLENFIQHNLSNVLPHHKVVIETNKHITMVWIKDSNEKPIIKAQLID